MKKQKGYALIYTMIFAMLALVTVVIVANALVKNVRTQRNTYGATAAYALAQAGIDKGWSKYQEKLRGLDGSVTTSGYNSYITYRYPASLTCALYERVINGAVSTNPIRSEDSVYEYKICYDTAVAGRNYIEAIGYHRGAKVKLKAKITHYGANPATNEPRWGKYDVTGGSPPVTNTYTCTNDTAIFSSYSLCSPLTRDLYDSTYDHSKDKIEITQM